MFTDDDLWLPILGMLVVCWVTVYYGIALKQTRSTQRRLEPATEFFKQLSKFQSKGHDKRLFAMLHSSVLMIVERGAVRAMSRCVAEVYGPLVSIDASTAQFKGDDKSVSVVARATFANLPSTPVVVDASWIVGRSKGWSVISFNVEPPPNREIDVLSFADPEEFADFGEKFVTSLLSSSPLYARGVMVEALKSKYSTEGDLAAEVGKIMAVCGGLRTRNHIDITMTSAERRTAVNENGSSFVSAIHIEFHVLGKLRDMEASVTMCFSRLQCFVQRYSLRALSPLQRHAIHDQSTGETIHFN
jgi:hypothetical protein